MLRKIHLLQVVFFLAQLRSCAADELTVPYTNLSLVPTSSARVVITFDTVVSRENAHIPHNVTLMKQYGRRLVVLLDHEYDEDSDREWLMQVFNASDVEHDSLVLTNSLQDNKHLLQTMGQWNLQDDEPFSIHPELLWNSTQGNSTQVIGVLDGGLPDISLPLFQNIIPGFDFISDENYSMDGDGRDATFTDPGDAAPECPLNSWHGLQVTSVLAATPTDTLPFTGVCSECSVLPVRVLGKCKTGYTSDVADALVWAVGGEITGVQAPQSPAGIIVMSFTGLGKCPSYLQSAVTQAVNTGAILITAAGNNAGDSTQYYPANCNEVVTVTATTRDGTVASYANKGFNVALGAPGGDHLNPLLVISLDSNAVELNVIQTMGTSFSVPQVAGVLALARSMNLMLSTVSVSFLTQRYEMTTAVSCYQNCGTGILDARRLFPSTRQEDFITMPETTEPSANSRDNLVTVPGITEPSTNNGNGLVNGAVACSAGTYSSNGQTSTGCTPCSAGTYSASAGASVCTPCPSGKISPAGATSASQCVYGATPVYTVFTKAFTYTGAVEQWVVPTGVTSIDVKMWGAGGGGYVYGYGGVGGQSGGSGGYTTGTIPVQSGQILAVAVGGGGTGLLVNGNTCGNTGACSRGGWPNGGSGFACGAGGGRSHVSVFPSGTTINSNSITVTGNTLLVAGGGGGGTLMGSKTAAQAAGHGGGGLSGSGFTGSSVGGSQTAPSGCTTATPCTNGLVYGTLFRGATGTLQLSCGGGDGYYGGSNSAAAWVSSSLSGGGAGGSAYIAPSVSNGATFVGGEGTGTVSNSPYNAADLVNNNAYGLGGPNIVDASWVCDNGRCTGQNGLVYLTYGVSCAAGSYYNSTISACTPCAAGSYYNSTTFMCTPCASGYVSASGATSCAKCSAGTYSPGGSTCTPCAAGYISASGASSCTQCSAGTYSAGGGSTCTPCTAGYVAASGASLCTQCSAGTYSAGGGSTCTPCAAGNIAAAGASSCTQCSVGTYSVGGTTCTPCSAGYISASGVSSCTQCSAGTYSPGGGSTCAPCAAGYISESGASLCTQCSAGTYSAGGGSTCTPCAAGYISASGASSCTQCSAGTYSTGGSTCIPCAPGSISTSGASSCTQCSAGTYSAGGGSTCTPCAAGNYSATSGASSCTPCAAGNGSSSSASSCAPCSAGTFSAGGTPCTPCSAGSYSPLPGANGCTQCPGTLVSAAGTSAEEGCTCPADSLRFSDYECVCNDGFLPVNSATVPGLYSCVTCDFSKIVSFSPLMCLHHSHHT